MNYDFIEGLETEQILNLYNDVIDYGNRNEGEIACGCYWYVECEGGGKRGVGYQPWPDCTTSCSAPNGSYWCYTGPNGWLQTFCGGSCGNVWRISPYSAG